MPALRECWWWRRERDRGRGGCGGPRPGQCALLLPGARWAATPARGWSVPSCGRVGGRRAACGRACPGFRSRVRTVPDEVIDCVVTSPPYWRLRDYATGAWNGGQPDCPPPPPTRRPYRADRTAPLQPGRRHAARPPARPRTHPHQLHRPPTGDLHRTAPRPDRDRHRMAHPRRQAWRAARALGYRRLITSTQHTCRMCSHADHAHASSGPPPRLRRKVPGRCTEVGCSCSCYEPGETGASLRAAGFLPIAQLPAHRGWDRPRRPRSIWNPSSKLSRSARAGSAPAPPQARTRIRTPSGSTPCVAM